MQEKESIYQLPAAQGCCPCGSAALSGCQKAILKSGKQQQPTGVCVGLVTQQQSLSSWVRLCTRPTPCSCEQPERRSQAGELQERTLLSWPGCITCTKNQWTGISWKIQQERIKGDAENRRIWINDIFQPSLAMSITNHCACYNEKYFSMRTAHFRVFLWNKFPCLLTPSFEMSQNNRIFWVRRDPQGSWRAALKGMAIQRLNTQCWCC